MSSLEILVGLDGSPWSEAATERALELARPGGGRLLGLHVLTVARLSGRLLDDLAGLLGFEPVLVPERVEAYYRERGQAYLEAFARRCEQAGLPHRELLEPGNPVDRLVHYGNQVDFVFLGARGLTEELLPGHGGRNMERAVRRLETSTFVVPAQGGPFRGLLLAYDGSDGAAKALRAVRHLLDLLPMPVHAVYVDQGGDPLVEVEEELGGAAELHLHRVEGAVGPALRRAAERWDCNLVALGYRSRGWLAGEALGRVTEWLLQREDLALLVSR